MPWKNKIRQKEYQAAYDKEWKVVNRDKWNVYQRGRKIEKRHEELAEIIEAVKGLNIDYPDSPTFRASVVLLLGLVLGVRKSWAVAYRTGYDISEVKEFYKNWIESGIFDGKLFDVEDWNNDLELAIILTLNAGVATGQIFRHKTGQVIPITKTA